MKSLIAKNKYYLLLFLAATLIFTGEWVNQKFIDFESNVSLNSFKKGLLDAEDQARSLLDTLSENTFEQNKNAFARLEKEYLEQGISFYIYKDDSLRLWSNIEALPPFYFREFYRPTYHQTDNGSYLFMVKSSGNIHSVVSINLVHHYLFSNKYLIDNSPIANNFAQNFKMGKPDKYEEKIKLHSDQIIASVSAKSKKNNPEVLAYLALFIILFTLLVSGHKVQVLTAAVALYVLGRVLNEQSILKSAYVFDASLYAGLFKCYADLIIFTIVIYLLPKHLKNEWSNRILYFIISLLIPIYTFELVINSVITLDTANTLELSLWSILSFLTLALLIATTLKLKYTFKPKKDIFTAAIMLIVAALCIAYFNYNWGLLAFPILFLGLSALRNSKLSEFKLQLLYSAVIAIAIFSNVEYLNHKKERNRLPVVVKNLVNQRDNVAEFLLSDFRKNLIEDAYVNSFFENTLLPKSVVVERINKLYLRGYLKKFEHSLLFAPKKIKFGVNPDPFLVKQVNQILQNPANKIAEGLYTTKLTGVSKTYLTEQYFINTELDTIGSLYILLNEKSFYDQSIYPELLIGENELSLNDDINFAYYKNQELISNLGALSYPIFKKEEAGNFKKLLAKDHNHFFYRPDNTTLFVVSTKKRSWFNYTSSFSIFLFLIGTLVLGIIYFKNGIRNILTLNRLWANASFSNRIRFSTLASVFMALVLLAIATNAYTQRKYEQKTLESLVKKANKAKLYFSSLYTKANNKGLSNDELQEHVLQFAEIYEADIDLFNQYGKLRASSQKILYENGILEGQLDGTAFFEVSLNGKSLFVKNEKIGKLAYTSAFVPVLNGAVIEGFVQLPYFKRQQDLRKDQANFVVTLFNIYLLILLILAFITALILRTVTRPLSLITAQIKNTSLTGANEKILWEKDDEIGLLVNEYNAMVDKLALSAKQLADSKQAEAWQEMARQVAHEIKNPLTPMKLNIQQLQRAWKDEHPNLEKIFGKVTSILINQIESLARIASNFSSFAKMPNIEKTDVELEQIFEEIAQLYNIDDTVIRIKKPQDNISIKADKEQLFRAINNLVKNGIQAVNQEETAQIDITYSAQKGEVLIIISDNGQGIGHHMKDKIFIPNFSTKSSGMGLGLAIVKQIIESHNGHISFKPNEQKGTQFIIKLPYK